MSDEKETKDAASTKATTPEPDAYYTVVKGPIKVRGMILAKGHKNLLLTNAQAAALGDHVIKELPTV
jgi:hypothetical protein